MSSRREQQQALREHLRGQFQQRLDAGLVPLDGVWLDPQGVERELEARSRRSRVVFREILALYGLMILVGLALLFLAWAVSA